MLSGRQKSYSKLNEINNVFKKEFSRIAGYKLYRNLSHFYTLMMKNQKEKTITFTVA